MAWCEHLSTTLWPRPNRLHDMDQGALLPCFGCGTSRCRRISPPLTPSQVRRALSGHRANLIMTLLGLKGCADTIVGNDRVRGVRYIATLATLRLSLVTKDASRSGLDRLHSAVVVDSGGERRRVTLAEMIMGSMSVACEFTTVRLRSAMKPYFPPHFWLGPNEP
jgi:hypothetical protein